MCVSILRTLLALVHRAETCTKPESTARIGYATNQTMDFSLNDHQKLIRDTVRQFMEAEVRPSVKQRDREERFPAEEIKKLAELGCCGMMIPEEWGGPGLDTLSYVLMLEEVARVDAAMATSLSVTNSAVQVPLVKFGTEEQKKKYLRRLATGEILGSFCLTEPAAGSDAAGIQARAVAMQRVGSGLGARIFAGPSVRARSERGMERSASGHARRRHLSAEWHEDLGVERARCGLVHCVCEDRSGRGRERHHGVSG